MYMLLLTRINATLKLAIHVVNLNTMTGVWSNYTVFLFGISFSLKLKSECLTAKNIFDTIN